MKIKLFILMKKENKRTGLFKVQNENKTNSEAKVLCSRRKFSNLEFHSEKVGLYLNVQVLDLF